MILQQPRNTKYAKQFKGRNKGFSVGRTICFGNYGLVAVERGRLNWKQLESFRKSFSRTLKRGAKLWFRINMHKAVSKKPLEVRMGKGKGSVDHWVAEIRPGTIIVETEYHLEEPVRLAFKKSCGKLPIKMKFIKKSLF